MEALTKFGEMLKGVKIRGKVFSALREALDQLSSRWLLCVDSVDNADDAAVRGILRELSLIADPEKGMVRSS